MFLLLWVALLVFDSTATAPPPGEKVNQTDTCISRIHVAPSPTQLWSMTTITSQVTSFAVMASSSIFNIPFSYYSMSTITNLRTTIITTPVAMVTYGTGLTTYSKCSDHLDLDCWTEKHFWVPAEVKTSIACGKITYADTVPDPCSPMKLAKQIYVVNTLGIGYLHQPANCKLAKLDSEYHSCASQYKSAYEIVHDIRQPNSVGPPPEEIKLDWCLPCMPRWRVDPITKTECTLIAKALRPDGVYLRKYQGEVYYFSPDPSERDMCAILPRMEFHNNSAAGSTASSAQRKYSRSAITMGKTMHEGTVYVHYPAYAAETHFPSTGPRTGFWPFNMSSRTAAQEVWLELKSAELSSMRPGEPGAEPRFYPINYGDLLRPHPYTAWRNQYMPAGEWATMPPFNYDDGYPWGMMTYPAEQAPLAIYQADMDMFTHNDSTVHVTISRPDLHRVPVSILTQSWKLPRGGDGFEFDMMVPEKLKDERPEWKDCMIPYGHKMDWHALTAVGEEVTITTDGAGGVSTPYVSWPMATPRATVTATNPQNTGKPSS